MHGSFRFGRYPCGCVFAFLVAKFPVDRRAGSNPSATASYTRPDAAGGGLQDAAGGQNEPTTQQPTPMSAPDAVNATQMNPVFTLSPSPTPAANAEHGDSKAGPLAPSTATPGTTQADELPELPGTDPIAAPPPHNLTIATQEDSHIGDSSC